MSKLQDAIGEIQRSGLSVADKGRISRLLRLTAMHAAEMTGPELREAREAAGLSMGHVAELTGWGRQSLFAMESYVDPASCPLKPEHAARLDDLYGLGKDGPNA